MTLFISLFIALVAVAVAIVPVTVVLLQPAAGDNVTHLHLAAQPEEALAA